jgi:hypothetical protein
VSRTCAFCECFDGGGLARVQAARESGVPIAGDCLNSGSPRFTTASDATCDATCDVFTAETTASINGAGSIRNRGAKGVERLDLSEASTKVSPDFPGGDV